MGNDKIYLYSTNSQSLGVHCYAFKSLLGILINLFMAYLTLQMSSVLQQYLFLLRYSSMITGSFSLLNIAWKISAFFLLLKDNENSGWA